MNRTMILAQFIDQIQKSFIYSILNIIQIRSISLGLVKKNSSLAFTFLIGE